MHLGSYFACQCPVVLAAFVEKIALLHWIALATLSEIICKGLFLDPPFCSTDLFVYSFTKTSVLITMVLKQVLKSGQVNSPILVFFFNIMYYSTQNYVGYLGDLSLRLHWIYRSSWG